MAALQFKSDHNKVAFLERVEGHEVFDPMVDFLLRSKIRFALTRYPNMICDSLVQQFWETTETRNREGHPTEIVATIDGVEYVVTKSLVRTQLQLDDADGEYHTNYDEILAGMEDVGYRPDNSKVWCKNKLCPKWRFLVHTLLQCLSPKTGGWDQFSTDLACGIVCLSKGITYNFSRFIFDGMLGNVSAKKHKFLMYPRFLQIIIGIETQK